MPSKVHVFFRDLWYRWKSLKLPWRKRFLVGLDLQGNTFWEFRDTFSHQNRMRRIVDFAQSAHYSDVQISPQWHQWLRHTRADPPTLTELSQDILRQQRLKILAAAADARWTDKSNPIENSAFPRDHSSISSRKPNSNGQPLSNPEIAASKDEIKIPFDF